ncbi:putative glycosyl hydrolases family 16 protein 8 [Elsinoe fawcettii]|nr:putative glycosyl hydrolases family 16 protein 8 [Elsinoe fawcettii]
MLFMTLLSCLVFLFSQPVKAIYRPTTTLAGDDFFSHFNFYSGPDPTNGYVQYVNRGSAVKSSLFALADHDLGNNSIFLGVDSTTSLSPDRPGRASLRLHGKEKFTHGLVVVDVFHAPTGCGLWPAIWMVDPVGTYPGNTGEIDIFEYVHDTPNNAVTLHTSDGCKIRNTTTAAPGSLAASRMFRRDAPFTAESNATDMQGHVESTNCYVKAQGQTNNKGCSIASPDTITPPPSQDQSQGKSQQSYSTAGEGFNDQGGGVYALLWTSETIEAYFFPRPLVPAELLVPSSPAPDTNTEAQNNKEQPSREIDPTKWRAQGHTPIAVFSGCDFDAHIKELSMVINTDFCGDWAGNVWESGGCAAKTGVGSCKEYVAKNPQSFEEAYWLLGGIEVWEEV